MVDEAYRVEGKLMAHMQAFKQSPEPEIQAILKANFRVLLRYYRIVAGHEWVSKDDATQTTMALPVSR